MAYGRRGTSVGCVVGLVVVSAAGCLGDDPATPPAQARPAWDLTWGQWRASPGNFVHPRGIAVGTGPDGTEVYVVDKTMRVQVFGADGTFRREWDVVPPQETVADNPGLRDPGYANRGYPVGVTVAPDGRVFLANTHYSEVAWYSPAGELLGRVGGYGDEPGQFVFPVRVAFREDGGFYVTEYGFGQHRVQRFDADGRPVGAFGRHGTAAGAFSRPNGCALGPDGLLYVCDAGNHRIQVFDEDGRRVRAFGRYGDGADGLKLPYGIAYDARHDRLLVAEYDGSRISAFDRTGRPLGKLADGSVRHPWDIAVDDTHAYVPCYRRHRIVRYPLEGLPGAGRARESVAHRDRPAFRTALASAPFDTAPRFDLTLARRSRPVENSKGMRR